FILFLSFLLHLSVVSSALHSFPTRRSSDLDGLKKGGDSGAKLPLHQLGLVLQHLSLPGCIQHRQATLQFVLAHPGGDSHALAEQDRKSTRLNSSHVSISYAVFCLKKKSKIQ